MSEATPAGDSNRPAGAGASEPLHPQPSTPIERKPKKDSGDLRARMVNHNKNKEFWERALIVTSRTNSMTQTHALFLEWHCIQSVREAGRFTDHNSTSGTRPHTPAPQRDVARTPADLIIIWTRWRRSRRCRSSGSPSSTWWRWPAARAA